MALSREQLVLSALSVDQDCGDPCVGSSLPPGLHILTYSRFGMKVYEAAASGNDLLGLLPWHLGMLSLR